MRSGATLESVDVGEFDPSYQSSVNLLRFGKGTVPGDELLEPGCAAFVEGLLHGDCEIHISGGITGTALRCACVRNPSGCVGVGRVGGIARPVPLRGYRAENGLVCGLECDWIGSCGLRLVGLGEQVTLSVIRNPCPPKGGGTLLGFDPGLEVPVLVLCYERPAKLLPDSGAKRLTTVRVNVP